MCRKPKIFKLAIVSFAFFLAGCSKGGPVSSLLEQRYCWQRIDSFGNPLEQVCNKTESQMKALYPNSCSYYKNDGEKSCWWVNGTFLSNMTKEGAGLYIRCFNPNAGTPVKVDCKYCQTFYHRKKMTYKPANTITYSTVSRERFCGDTSFTLYHGRQIVLKDTPDSLIVRQFSSNGTAW